jgi:hypothetical protein
MFKDGAKILKQIAEESRIELSNAFNCEVRFRLSFKM